MFTHPLRIKIELLVDSARLIIILLVVVSTVWGYGILAVTIISLTSLVGVATIPFFGKKMYKKILATLVALAVGTLAGDALLHLLPHVWIILLHNIVLQIIAFA